MSPVTWLVLSGAVGLTAGLGGAAGMLVRARRGALPFDLPDTRRLHAAPTPRGGGIGIVVAGVAALPIAVALGGPVERRLLTVLVLVWALPNGLIGLIDDHRALSPRMKLAIQLVAASAAVALGLRMSNVAVPPLGTLALGPLAMPLCVLWLVWMANVFNFMDGIDALAAECGAVFFTCMAGFALLGGAAAVGAPAVAAAAALLGFLRYNLPPARIFMGDGGSLFAGALLGGLAIALARDDVAGVPLVASGLVLGSFGFDATFTVVRRALRGLALRPHRTHFYQRLALAGWPHHRVRVLYVALTAAGGAGALAILRGSPVMQATALVVVPASLLVIVGVTRRAERRVARAGAQRT